MKLTISRVKEILSEIKGLKVAVIGDFFVDGYFYEKKSFAKPSKETGLPNRPYPTKNRIYDLGGAANIAKNLKALGIDKVFALTVIGDGDEYSPYMMRLLEKEKINTDYIVQDQLRTTPTYIKKLLEEGGINQPSQRYIETNREDFLNDEPLSSETESRLIKKIEECFEKEKPDSAIICDQVENPIINSFVMHTGVFTPKIIQYVNEIAKNFPNIPFVVDSRNDITKFERMIWKPNFEEAVQILNEKLSLEDKVKEVECLAKLLYKKSKKPVYITLGEKGVVLATEDVYGPLFPYAIHIPAIKIDGEIDSVGAGDTFIASLAASLGIKSTYKEAAEFSVLSPAVTIKKLYTTGAATSQEILRIAEKCYK